MTSAANSSYQDDLAKATQCSSYDEFEKLMRISPSSPEAYWAELAWTAAHSVGFQAAWIAAMRQDRS